MSFGTPVVIMVNLGNFQNMYPTFSAESKSKVFPLREDGPKIAGYLPHANTALSANNLARRVG